MLDNVTTKPRTKTRNKSARIMSISTDPPIVLLPRRRNEWKWSGVGESKGDRKSDKKVRDEAGLKHASASDDFTLTGRLYLHSREFQTQRL